MFGAVNISELFGLKRKQRSRAYLSPALSFTEETLAREFRNIASYHGHFTLRKQINISLA
jgi:hypothetical protein